MEEDNNIIDTTDRISSLPHFIVHHILSFIWKDTKALVRMSVLSNEWFGLTASLPFLYFDLGEWRLKLFGHKYFTADIREMFFRYVEHTMSRFCDQNVSAHTLHISAKIMEPEQQELVGQCLDLVIEKGLQVLVIKYEKHQSLPMLRLPKTLLSASSLTSLTLCKCELPSSLMDDAVKFKSLKLLSLTYSPIDEGVIEHLNKSCPVLEEIYLKYCFRFKTFCVKRHDKLQNVEIYSNTGLERIDIKAPNLNFFVLVSNEDKAPSIFMDSCKKLTTFFYSGSPLKRLGDFLSNFPFLEAVTLRLSSHVDNLKLSSHSLRRLKLHSDCDLEEIDLNTPNLLFFEYNDRFYRANIKPLSRKHVSLSKGYMKCVTHGSADILWYQKFRQFLEKNGIFKDLKFIHHSGIRDVEKLKLIQSSPYELEHAEIINSFRTDLVDVLLLCCRPRSLTLYLYHHRDTGHIVKDTYDKLLRQEIEGQTNIKFVVLTSYKDTHHFNDLNSLLNWLALDRAKRRRFSDGRRGKITFIKEEVVREAG